MTKTAELPDSVEPDDGPELGPGEHLVEYPDLFPGLKLICSLNTDKDELVANIKSSVARKLPQVWPHQPQETEIGICAGGPSLHSTLDHARDLVSNGGKLIACANAMHVLTEAGIQPSGQVILDAKPRNAEFLRDVPGCTYFVASQAAPVVFDTLEGFTAGDQRTFIWHAVNSDEEFSAIMDGLGEPWCRISGGSTITIRTMQLLKTLGYSKFHLFGFDSCFIDGKHHAYPQPVADDFRVQEIDCNGRTFEVAGWMLSQALEFVKYVKLVGDEMKLQIYGDGLIAHMVRTTRAEHQEN
jgi:hypothetical protein